MDDYPTLTGEVWYRYADVQYSAGCDEVGNLLPYAGPVGIRLEEHGVAKHTPKGVWLISGRFVLKDSRKRFACPTKEEAMASFIARKQRQIRILSAQLARATEAVRKAACLNTQNATALITGE